MVDRPQPRPTNPPRTSPKPKTRQDAEVDRQMMMSGMDVEFRADLEPVLGGDPLSRIGYEGGVKFADIPGDANFFASYTNASNDKQSVGDYFSGIEQGVQPDDIVLSSAASSVPVIGHEMRHRGINRVANMFAEDPEYFAKTYGRETAVFLRDYLMKNQDKDYEEAMTERGDTPHLDEKWNLPKHTVESGHLNSMLSDETGKTFGMTDTITELHKFEGEELDNIYGQLNKAAQDMLTKSGEPPKTVPREIEEKAAEEAAAKTEKVEEKPAE